MGNVEQVSETISNSFADKIADTFHISSSFVESVLAFGGKVLIALVILLIGLFVMRLAVRFVKRTMQKSHVDGIIHNYLVICIKTLIWVILIISILTILGVPTTSLIAIISAAGVAIALALQDSLSNLAGGLLIIINKPFSKGDLIETQGLTGVVEEIHLMNCKLHTIQNKAIIIPNRHLFDGTIVNCSSTGYRRIDVSVSVDYQADLQKVKSTLLRVAAENPLVLADPAPLAGVAELEESGIKIDFLVWCETQNYISLFYNIREEVLLAFRQEQIEIPFPQMEIRLKETEHHEKSKVIS